MSISPQANSLGSVSDTVSNNHVPGCSFAPGLVKMRDMLSQLHVKGGSMAVTQVPCRILEKISVGASAILF